MLKDFVYAARSLRKSPVFAATAIITIALGVGASTAIFSVTNAVLLRPLPYKDPSRLVVACTDMKKRNVVDFPWSDADFIDVHREAVKNFEDFASVNTGRAPFQREDGSTELVSVAGVSTNFFRLMGARIAYGRDFIEADGQPQPTPPPAPGVQPQAQPQQLPAIAILSYEYWQRRFGGNPAIIGQEMPGAAQPRPQIVGVLKPGMELLFPPSANLEQHPDIWFAARLRYDSAQRNNVQHRVIGRLKESAALDAAQAEVNLTADEIRRINTIKNTAGFQIRLVPMSANLVAEVRPAILALMGAVIFLLLIACANVANLLLVRASLRERELAVRTALGGSSWRLIRQMLAESLLLAVVGTALGISLAWAGIHELLVIAPANLPRLDAISIDPAVVGFAAIAGLAAAAIFGIVPALRASRPDVMHVLRSSGRTGGLAAGKLLRNAVVIVEVALCFVLLVGSGLMFRSFLALQRINPGFDPQHLLTFSTVGRQLGPKPEERAAYQRDLRSRLASIPGVESATASFPFPLTGGFSPIRWGTEQALADTSKFQAVDFQLVLPGYFETMRTPLIEGRTFTDADNAPDRKLVVIDTMLAGKAYPGQSSVGKRILIRINTPDPEWVEIIGVVAHQRQTSLAEPGREQLYFTDGYIGHGVARRFALRTSGDPASYAAQIRAEAAKFDPHILLTEMQTADNIVDKAQASTRFSLLLIGVFAMIAALLAGVGLYGVLSTVVRQRTAEIGVRMALGAAPKNIFGLVVGQGMMLSVLGIIAGIAAAFWLTRVMTTMLVGVKATDPVTFIAMIALFLLIAGIASWLPARRAAGLDPTIALREE